MWIKFPPSQTPTKEQIEEALQVLSVKHREQKIVNSDYYIEFYHVIEAVSFLRETNRRFLSEETNVFFLNIPQPVGDNYEVKKYKMFTVPPADQDILAKNAIFVLSISMETLTGYSQSEGEVRSPHKISCFSNHGKFSASVTPLTLLESDQLSQSAGVTSQGDRLMLNSQTHIRNENELFVQKLTHILNTNIKLFGSSNRYDKAVLQFYTWSEAQCFLSWYSRAADLSWLAQVIFTVTVVEQIPGQSLRHVGALHFDQSDTEERAMFMHFLIDDRVNKLEQERADEPFINLEECLTIEKLLSRENAVREEQILCFLVIWFRIGAEGQNISKIQFTLSNSNKKTLTKMMKTPPSVRDSSSKKLLLLYFLETVNKFVQKNGNLPVTLVCFSNPQTLSILLDVAKRHSLEENFKRIFRNVCDLQSIIDIRGQDQQLEPVRNVASEFLKKMCSNLMPCENIFVDITKYSRPFSRILCWSLDPFPLELNFSGPDMTLFKGDRRTVLMNVDDKLLSSCRSEDLRFVVFEKYPVTQMNPVVENGLVKVNIRADNDCVIKKNSVWGVFIPKFESFTIPSKVMLTEKDHSMYLPKMSPVNFNIARTESEPGNVIAASKRPGGQTTEEKPPTPAPPPPPILKLTEKVENELEDTTFKVKVEKTAAAPPPPPSLQLGEPEKISVKTEPERVESEIQDLDIGTDSDDFPPQLNVFIYIEQSGEEISTLDVQFSNGPRSHKFERYIGDGSGSSSQISPSQAVGEMIEFLLSKFQRDRQTLRVVTMCPDTHQIVQSWVDKHIPLSGSFSDIFSSQTSIASLVNDYKVSGLLKGTYLKGERLATYYESLTSTQLSPEKPKTVAMREVFEKLNVKDDMFEAVRLPSGSYLLFFFHVDIIDSKIVSLGYYTTNQQSHFTALKLGSLTEQAKKLGFTSPTRCMARHLQKEIDCEDEKTGLLHFLSMIERQSKEYKMKPILVSLSIQGEVSKLFEGFLEHNLLGKAFEVIAAIGSIEEFCLKREKKRFTGLTELNTTNLELPDINSLMASKLSQDFLLKKLEALPTYENFGFQFGHPLRSPYLNRIFQEKFPEDKYKIVSKSEVKLPSSSNLSVPIKVELLGSTNLEKNRILNVLMVPPFKRQSRTNISKEGEFEITFTQIFREKGIINKGEVVAFGFSERKEAKSSKKPTAPTKSSRYRVYTEKAFDVGPGETRERSSDVISKSLSDGVSVEVKLLEDERGELFLDYQKHQTLTDGKIKYCVKNISGKRIKIPKRKKIGHLTIARATKVPRANDISNMKDSVNDLKIKFPGYEDFISEAVQKCLEDNVKEIATTIEETVLEMNAWIKKSPSEILEKLKKDVNQDNSSFDARSVFIRLFPDSGYTSDYGFSLISETFMRIVKSKYCKVKQEPKVKEEKVGEENFSPLEKVAQMWRIDDSIRVKDPATIDREFQSSSSKTGDATSLPTSSEYVEYHQEFKKEEILHPVLELMTDEFLVDHDFEDIDIGDVKVLKIKLPSNLLNCLFLQVAENITDDHGVAERTNPDEEHDDTEANLVINKVISVGDSSTESTENNRIAAENFPETKGTPEVTTHADNYPNVDGSELLLNLPPPCPVLARRTSKETKGEEVNREGLETPSEPDQSGTVERTDRRIDEVPDPKSDEVRVKKTRKKIVPPSEPDSEKSQRTTDEKHEMENTRKVVIGPTDSEPEERDQSNNNWKKFSFCPHFQDERFCLKCNSLRRGKVKCCHVVKSIYSQDLCRSAATKPEGCLNEDCEKNHEIPEHCHLPYCEAFLRGTCQQAGKCIYPHLTFVALKKKLKKAIDDLRENCKICQKDYEREYNKLMRKQNQPKRKRVVCKHFQAGICSYGSSCFKIHDAPDLRRKLAKYS